MKHLHRNVILSGLVAAALVAGAFVLLGIGFAAIVAVGLFVLGAVTLMGLVVFEEQTRVPWWEDAKDVERDHGYHPAR
jgi:hypothetical protein